MLEWDMDDCMATARRAAALATRKFRPLKWQVEEVNQNAYVAMLIAMREAKPDLGNEYAFIYRCCYNYVVCGLMNRNDYTIRRMSLWHKKHDIRCEADERADIVISQIWERANVNEFEESVIRDLYRNGETTVSIAKSLGYTASHIGFIHKTVINRMRAVLNLGPLPRRHSLRTPSMTRGARSMRKRARERSK